jgi:protein involved in polysaccharide export with SLBB domain
MTIMNNFLPRTFLLAAVALATLAPSRAAWAQDALGVQRRQATRAELEQAVQVAEQVATNSSVDAKTREKLRVHVAALQQRLRTGDFLPGDRILIKSLGDSALNDTFTVRVDQRLQLPNLPDIALRGVLDSELNSHLSTELAKFLVNPSVTATGLVRLAVSGAVGRPGFILVPVDQAVTDVLMNAGGPSQLAKLNEAIVRRGDEKFLNEKQFAEAVRTGRTVGDVSLRDGDEIVVPAGSATAGGRLGRIGAIASASMGVVWLLLSVGRRGF